MIVFQAWRYFPSSFPLHPGASPGNSRRSGRGRAGRRRDAHPERFRYILLPQLAGVIGLLVVLRFIWTFNEFDDIYLLTGGGAGTEVVSVGIYNQLIGRGDIGSAAALSLVLAALLCILLLIYFRRQSRGEAVP